MTIEELKAEIRCRAEFDRLVELATDTADRIDYLGWLHTEDDSPDAAFTIRRLFWRSATEFSRAVGVPHGTILRDMERVYDNF
jgi:hypothetical protein